MKLLRNIGLILVEEYWFNNNTRYFMVNIYASQELTERIGLWMELIDFVNGNEVSYLLFCDFNEVSEEGNRFGSVFFYSRGWYV